MKRIGEITDGIVLQGNTDNKPAVKVSECNVVKVGERAYLSAYTDEIPTAREAEIIMRPMFAMFKIESDAIPAYVSSVRNARMTRRRLTDAMAYCCQNATFAPKPVEIIKFDKADETRRLYYSAEMYDICQKLMCKYYDMDCSENVYQSTKIYDACRNAYFSAFGRYWILNELGQRQRQEIEAIEKMSKYDIVCVCKNRIFNK